MTKLYWVTVFTKGGEKANKRETWSMGISERLWYIHYYTLWYSCVVACKRERNAKEHIMTWNQYLVVISEWLWETNVMIFIGISSPAMDCAMPFVLSSGAVAQRHLSHDVLRNLFCMSESCLKKCHPMIQNDPNDQIAETQICPCMWMPFHVFPISCPDPEGPLVHQNHQWSLGAATAAPNLLPDRFQRNFVIFCDEIDPTYLDTDFAILHWPLRWPAWNRPMSPTPTSTAAGNEAIGPSIRAPGV